LHAIADWKLWQSPREWLNQKRLRRDQPQAKEIALYELEMFFDLSFSRTDGFSVRPPLWPVWIPGPLRCKAENPKAAPHDGTCQVYSPGADCRSFVASICSSDIRRRAPACRRSNSSGLMRACNVPRASSPGIAASDLGVRSLCACGNWEGTCGAVCRNCAQAQ
jgi:hypothetical protein